jgi:hypothetical protein
LFFRVGRVRARLSLRVGAGFHGSGGVIARRGRGAVGQPGFGSACKRLNASVIMLVQGQCRAKRR